ncbi:peptidoglycan-associated outer membrane lipoprotein precursor [Lysobacter korlensis]|uniref:Peptidoglycan-associated outer membrane lipoprotein n=1 Tax=Lysobacter korlensis TaxID=553636 RepID=A0ABV6RP47_9GAMM
MKTGIRFAGVALAASLALSGCATYGQAGVGAGVGAPSYGGSTANCFDCGTVLRIEQVGGSRAPSATGAVLGGLVGAAAGREVAEDRSEGRRNTATVAGAAAGAVAGNMIQRGMSAAAYNVHVRMNDGRTTVVTQNDLGGIREGSYVRVADGRAWLR